VSVLRGQLGNRESVLEFYREMLRLRKRFQEVFVFGTHTLLDRENESTWSYLKDGTFTKKDASRARGKALVVMNFTTEAVPLMAVLAALGC